MAKQPTEAKKDAMEKKQEALKTVEKIFKLRLFLIPVAIIFVVILKFILKPFPAFYLTVALIIGMSLLILPFIFFIKRYSGLLSARTVYLIIAAAFTLELIGIFFLFYLWLPVIIYYIGGGAVFILTITLLIETITSNPIFNNKKYSNFFFLASLSLIIIFGTLEHLKIYPTYPLYPIESVRQPGQIKTALFPLIMAVLLFTVIQSRLENFWDMFRKQTQRLKLLNIELEEKVKNRTEELEEAKSILEIKVTARTKELKELASGLEEQVAERTQELQTRINELEKFHKLTVGRELKMKELKDKIKELEDKSKE